MTDKSSFFLVPSQNFLRAARKVALLSSLLPPLNTAPFACSINQFFFQIRMNGVKRIHVLPEEFLVRHYVKSAAGRTVRRSSLSLAALTLPSSFLLLWSVRRYTVDTHPFLATLRLQQNQSHFSNTTDFLYSSNRTLWTSKRRLTSVLRRGFLVNWAF